MRCDLYSVYLLFGGFLRLSFRAVVIYVVSLFNDSFQPGFCLPDELFCLLGGAGVLWDDGTVFEEVFSLSG